MLTRCLLAFLTLLPAVAFADRIIIAPSAYTLSTGLGAEVLQTVQYKPRTVSYIDAGTATVQLELAYVAKPGINRLALGTQTPVLPETFTTPALSVGISDIANSAGAFRGDGFYGRGYYIVLTKGLDNDYSPPKIHDVTISGGIGNGSIHGFFGGVTSELPLGLLGTVEFDSRSLNYRVSLPMSKKAGISFDRIDGADFVGLELHTAVQM